MTNTAIPRLDTYYLQSKVTTPPLCDGTNSFLYGANNK